MRILAAAVHQRVNHSEVWARFLVPNMYFVFPSFREKIIKKILRKSQCGELIEKEGLVVFCG